jgi:hypothetical protein
MKFSTTQEWTMLPIGIRLDRLRFNFDSDDANVPVLIQIENLRDYLAVLYDGAIELMIDPDTIDPTATGPCPKTEPTT